jgi:hypothetical protein
MNEIQLIPQFVEVPTKTEMIKAVKTFIADGTKTLISKYIVFKAMENLVKEGLKLCNRKEVISSFLEVAGGSESLDVLGAKVQVTKERVTTTIKKYQFSEKLEELEKKNNIKIDELKIKIKALEIEVKERQVHEINSEIAVDISEALTGESEEPEYGIKVTIPK